MRKILGILLLAFSAQLAFPQAPGYLGRKTSVGVSLNTFPNIFLIGERRYIDRTSLLRSYIPYGNHRLSFLAEHVADRKLSAGIAADIFGNKFPYEKFDYWVVPVTSEELIMKYSGKSVRLTATFTPFGKRRLTAPLGIFFRAEAGVTKIKLLKDYWADDYSVLTDKGEQEFTNNLFFVATAGWGNTKALSDRILLTISNEFGYTNNLTQYNWEDDIEYLLALDLKRYMTEHFVWSLKITFKYLLF